MNLFTGDFSYSIPLLDVGGYPVNLFYNSGIGMEQDASWVGLGWNINPGSVSRNMRGVPDDFDGTEMLEQSQNVKPNRTWGGEFSVDGEVFGKKVGVEAGIGYSYNNYLGPEIDIDLSASTSFSLGKNQGFHATAPRDGSVGLGLGLGAKLSSRSGLTLSPSLNAKIPLDNNKIELGIGLRTSYNSRTGIRDINLNMDASWQRSVIRSTGLGTGYLKLSEVGKANGGTGDFHSNLICFSRPSYTPSMHMPMQYKNIMGRIDFGVNFWGLTGHPLALSGYYSESKVADGKVTIKKPMVGYMYLENALKNKDAVMDFNRLGDQEVTPSTQVISAPQYTYDVFAIQGEGTGGSIRAYRGNQGFVRDNVTTSSDSKFDLGADIAPWTHFGANLALTLSSQTRAGGWDQASNTLNQSTRFKGPDNQGGSFENVYFKNPGEGCVSNPDIINNLGGDNLVRFAIDGAPGNPVLTTKLEKFDKGTIAPLGIQALANQPNGAARDKRTQVITMLTARDAANIGLDKDIKNYQSGLKADNTLNVQTIPRVGGYRMPTHISEINVLEQSGMRYVYGLPVYNITQEDYTFSVGNTPADPVANIVKVDTDEPDPNNSHHLANDARRDGSVTVQKMPPYATSFLLTGLLSPDYVDVTGDGITEDDLGGAVKFNYDESAQLHKWRTPRNAQGAPGITAHYNEGVRSEDKDNKATISYGEREAWYMHSIESKSMVAIFNTSSANRADGKGVGASTASANASATDRDRNSFLNGSGNNNEQANVRLERIDLYTKADLKAHGLAGAVPLKTVHFDYDNSLCQGSRDNPLGGGKLTLKDVYFTYNGQDRQSKDKYVFGYDHDKQNSATDNPTYTENASDRWGTYKPASANPKGLSNIDYPYTLNTPNKALDDAYAGAWALKRILLPSGGQMEVQYEADDYGYVQNRRACDMMPIYGFGNGTGARPSNQLYYGKSDQNYVYISLPKPLANIDPIKQKQEIYSTYLETLNQFAFRLDLLVPKGNEPITAYANLDDNASLSAYGLCSNSTAANPIIYIRLKDIDGIGPLANSSVQYMVNNLPNQVFNGYDQRDLDGLESFLNMVSALGSAVLDAFTSAASQVREKTDCGNKVNLDASFIRLCSPYRTKYGGGHRVRQVTVRDNWDRMAGAYRSEYGQDYDYTTTQMVDDQPVAISSGVASYEPGIGSEENPFREILQYKNQLPLASAIYGSLEMPTLEAFYPSPVVGYSKVTVRSINRNGNPKFANKLVKSSIGSQVTEFYTARDYPTFSSYTPMKSLDYHSSPLVPLLLSGQIDRRTASQGFLVETNDMHGKLRSQSAYSESDPVHPLSYTTHTYKNTGTNGLADVVDYVDGSKGGAVTSGNMGVDMELMTDTREFSSSNDEGELQLNVDILYFLVGAVPVFSAWPQYSFSENLYRAVTTTKLINYHAIEDRVTVNDKGSTVATQTIAYDAETGSPLVTRTENEFKDPIYNISYPAYWAYSGTGLAYKNIGITFSGVNFNSGKVTDGSMDQSLIESGDELYITNMPVVSSCANPFQSPSTTKKIWAIDQNKDITALTVLLSKRNFVYVDADGLPYNMSGVNCTIVRSGHRNLLGLSVAGATTMANPIRTVNGQRILVIDPNSNAVAASAVAYQEKWQTDPGVIGRFNTVSDGNCGFVEQADCNGDHLQKNINPYLKGLLGNYRPYRSYTYYGDRKEDLATKTNIRTDGYLKGFGPYWNFDANNNLVPNAPSNSNWVWNSQLTRANARGQELETMDALGRYTSAQYGYAQNLPVAMAQNARDGESFEEGFEDYNYVEALNSNAPTACDHNRYVSFDGAANTSIVPMKGHTGNHALLIANGSFIKPLSILATPNNNYGVNWQPDITKQLVNVGGNLISQKIFPTYKYPNSILYNGSYTTDVVSYLQTQTTYSNGGFQLPPLYMSDDYTTISGTVKTHSFEITTSYYIEVKKSGNYHFYFTLHKETTEDLPCNTLFMSALIQNIDGTPGIGIYSSDGLTANVCLAVGIYQVTPTVTNKFCMSTNGGGNGYFGNCCQSTETNNSWGYTISMTTDIPTLSYKSLSTLNGCSYLHPLAGDPSMFNPTFALTPGKRMQFSAWANTSGNGSNGQVQVQFSGGSDPVNPNTVTLNPGGPVIEGWQKVEGDFTVPNGTISANLALNNGGNGQVYFDDIRMHPFNANMKGYVYDPQTLRLSAELDENNYASYYEYDAEGQLVRVKKETVEGVKTIQETHSGKQKLDIDLGGGTIFYNIEQKGNLTPDNCAAGTTSPPIAYDIAANLYSSYKSVDEANAFALVAARAYVNTHTQCPFVNNNAGLVPTPTNCSPNTIPMPVPSCAIGVNSANATTQDAANTAAIAKSQACANGQATNNPGSYCPALPEVYGTNHTDVSWSGRLVSQSGTIYNISGFANTPSAPTVGLVAVPSGTYTLVLAPSSGSANYLFTFQFNTEITGPSINTQITVSNIFYIDIQSLAVLTGTNTSSVNFTGLVGSTASNTFSLNANSSSLPLITVPPGNYFLDLTPTSGAGQYQLIANGTSYFGKSFSRIPVIVPSEISIQSVPSPTVNGCSFLSASVTACGGTITGRPGSSITVSLVSGGPPPGTYTLNFSINGGSTTVSNGSQTVVVTMPQSGSISYTANFNYSNSSGSAGISVQ